MNERIFTELYKKAWGHFPCPTGEPELRRFAELIVRECLFIVDDERKPDMVSRTELWHQIGEHFGVEK